MTPTRTRGTFGQFWATFAPSMPPHREQRRYIGAVEQAHGTLEALLLWAKKAAKSTTAAMRGLHYLTTETRDPEDRLIAIASHDEEQSRIIFAQAEQIVRRHAKLSASVDIRKNELIFEETCREPRTGGQFTRKHCLRALARDQRGLHGEPWSLVIRDELWSEPNHEMTEALIPSPARPYTELLYLSYAPLATMRRAGIPLHDLLERVKAGDPHLFYSFVGGTGDDASWTVCPWISSDWIEQQRRVFAASPSRFRRVVLNEQVIGGNGDTLLTVEDIAAAIDRTPPAGVAADRSQRYIGGLDLAVSNDHACFVVGHLGAGGRFAVDLCQVWRPRDGRSIAFVDIEDAIIAAHARLPMSVLNIDQWNAKLLSERLARAGVPARTVGVEQTRLNEIITVLKSAFTRRAIRIPASETYLIEQLEALRVLETRTPRRDLLKFAPSGTGLDPSQHDDAAVALGLCLIDRTIKDRIGRESMAPIASCNLADRGLIPNVSACFLAGGMYVPAGHRECIRDCAAFRSTRAAKEAHDAAGGEGMGLREYVASGRIAPCEFMSRQAMERYMANYR
jgi:Phage Terminase